MISKDDLLAAVLKEEDVEIPDRGTVRVRALTRAEALRLNQATPEEAEVIALSAGLVDPALTTEEVRQLLEASPATELQPVVDAILSLSGMNVDAQKSGGAQADAGGDRRNGVHAGAVAGNDTR